MKSTEILSERRSSLERFVGDPAASYVVGVHLGQGIEEKVSGRDKTMVDANQGCDGQPCVADSLKDCQALAKANAPTTHVVGVRSSGRTPLCAKSMGGGEQAQQHDSNEADLAERTVRRTRVEHAAFGRREILPVELMRG
jgi:hypothetical protein